MNAHLNVIRKRKTPANQRLPLQWSLCAGLALPLSPIWQPSCCHCHHQSGIMDTCELLWLWGYLQACSALVIVEWGSQLATVPNDPINYQEHMKTDTLPSGSSCHTLHKKGRCAMLLVLLLKQDLITAWGQRSLRLQWGIACRCQGANQPHICCIILV